MDSLKTGTKRTFSVKKGSVKSIKDQNKKTPKDEDNKLKKNASEAVL